MPQFQISLQRKKYCKSIYANKVCYEYARREDIISFIRNDMGIKLTRNNVKYETEADRAKDYNKAWRPKKQAFQIEHEMQAYGWGRMQTKGNLSLNIWHRPTRHAICKNADYIDIDMENACPRIVYEVLKQNNRIGDNSELFKYTLDPKLWRVQIMEIHKVSKDAAKKCPIAIINGGSYDQWIKENNAAPTKIGNLVGLEKELEPIREYIYGVNVDMRNDVLKYIPDKWSRKRIVNGKELPVRNLDGSFQLDECEAKRGIMALWYQTIEKYCQETAISFLVRTKNIPLADIIPCQDGMMMPSKYYYQGLLVDIEEEVSKRCEIYNLRWATKDFDEAITIPEINSMSITNWKLQMDAYNLATRFLELYSNNLVKTTDGQMFVYDDKTKKWYNETNLSRAEKLTLMINGPFYEYMFDLIENDFELAPNEKTDLKLQFSATTRGKISKIRDVLQHIQNQVVVNTEIQFDGYPNLLGFENGLFDLDKNEFREREFNDYITQSTGYDYIQPNYETPEYHGQRETLIEIFEDIFPDEAERNYVLQMLASSLDGHQYPFVFMLTGKGGNGKGVMMGLLEKVLGCSYFICPNNGVVREFEKANSASPDMYNLKGKRMIDFRELEGDIKIGVLKNLTGGGKLSARKLNCDPEFFSLNATIAMELNVAVGITGKVQNAERRRIKNIPLKTIFCDESNVRCGKTIHGISYKKGNNQYIQPDWQEKYKHVFLDLLIGVYGAFSDKSKGGMKFNEPKSVIDSSKEYCDSMDIFRTIVYKLYEDVELPSDATPEELQECSVNRGDMWNRVKAHEDYRTISFNEKRGNYNNTKFFEWLNDNMIVEGKPKKAYWVRFVKEVKTTYEEDEEEEE
jgi:phage/plasmid-associated DNA primase